MSAELCRRAAAAHQTRDGGTLWQPWQPAGSSLTGARASAAQPRASAVPAQSLRNIGRLVACYGRQRSLTPGCRIIHGANDFAHAGLSPVPLGVACTRAFALPTRQLGISL